MIELLKTWGTLLVAVVALIQPWILALWKRFFRQGALDIHETGTIEAGYSSFGPTIGLYGTLRTLHRDQFVRSIDLLVTKQKDSSRHVFEWGVFRSQKFTLAGTQEGSFELPAGFLLTTTQPQRYNIQFFDMTTQAEIKPYLVNVVNAWSEATRNLDQRAWPAQAQAAIQDALARQY